jgi:hypothetical protein|tara:strand:- start:14725 stop:15117 length:393 start_codon:yes stop_codon:yes gene_type:complete
MDPKVNDETSLGINLKWLVQIIIVAALAVWAYFGLTSKISQLQIDVMRMKDAVEMNSEFRVKWPLGQLGALPDDAEQNMRLRFIEKDMQMIEAHVDTLRIRSVQQEELHNPPHPFMPQSPLNRKEAGGLR